MAAQGGGNPDKPNYNPAYGEENPITPVKKKYVDKR